MKKAAVIGFPVKHSWSPTIHNYWIKEHGISGEYEKIEVHPNDLKSLVISKKEQGFSGLNITIPHKEKVTEICDELSESARVLQAVNLITFKNNIIYGDNTDGGGFVESLKEDFPDINLSSLRIGILGAGGAAKSIALSLSKENPKKIFVFNRNIDRAEKLLEKVNFHAAEPLNIDDINLKKLSIDLLINATPVGMAGMTDTNFINFKNIGGIEFFADIVYNPENTESMSLARSQNIKTMGGLGMLLYQAVPSFESFFGVRPEVTNGLKQHLLEHIRRGK
tara:strand:+ start:241 stop:1080 length:840 start_codon:yes stop_codon:yes gene_type:complete